MWLLTRPRYLVVLNNKSCPNFLFQVTDPQTGWTEFRPFHPETWLHLTIAHNCPFLWSSATCNEGMLVRLCKAFSVPREDMAVLSMSPNRPNIYIQRRVTKRALSLG